MSIDKDRSKRFSRREMLLHSGGGFGALALAGLMPPSSSAARGVSADSSTGQQPHHVATAKSVIFLFMDGGPSHLDTFDPKPALERLAGKPIPVYGAGENVRDWLYVEDHADALLTVLQKGRLGRSYNIGGESEARNIDLVRMICAILDEKRPKNRPYAEQITFVTDRPGHDLRYAIDPTRIATELGWRPSVTLEEGLEKTVQWYLDNEDWWRALQDRDGVGKRLGAGT